MGCFCREDGELKIRASKHWLAHHRAFLLHLSQPTITPPRSPSEAVRAPAPVIFGGFGVTVPYSPPRICHQPSAQNTTTSLRRAQAHTKAMLWQPRSPRGAAKSVTRRSALPSRCLFSRIEGLRTASAGGGGGGGGGVNPPKQTSQVTQIGSGSRRGRQSRNRSLARQDPCAPEDLASKTWLGPNRQNMHAVARPETLIKYA